MEMAFGQGALHGNGARARRVAWTWRSGKARCMGIALGQGVLHGNGARAAVYGDLPDHPLGEVRSTNKHEPFRTSSHDPFRMSNHELFRIKQPRIFLHTRSYEHFRASQHARIRIATEVIQMLVGQR